MAAEHRLDNGQVEQYDQLPGKMICMFVKINLSGLGFSLSGSIRAINIFRTRLMNKGSGLAETRLEQNL